MILVVGATGRLGGVITEQLLAAGKDVRILLRHNSPSEALATRGMATSAQSLIEARAQPVFGDMQARVSLDAACIGIEVVVTTANTALRGGEDSVRTVDLDGNRNLVGSWHRGSQCPAWTRACSGCWLAWTCTTLCWT
jgi:NADH dehydrogenase